jgi:acetyltransferase-like isoleucine patch superfamily enzyme
MNMPGPYKQVNVKAGSGCQIDPLSSLENVVLGRGVRIANGVQLWNVVIGDGSKLSRNVTFYSSDAKRPVHIGRSAWISFGVFGEGTGGEIRIEDYAVVAHSSTILTSSGPGEVSPILRELFPDQTGPVVVGPHSWIGAHCLLLPDTVLLEGTVVAANSVARKATYEPWSVYGGSPARLLKKLDPGAVAAARQRWQAGQQTAREAEPYPL